MRPSWRADRWARLHRATSLLIGDDARLAAHRGEASALLSAFAPEVVGEYWKQERVLVLAVQRAGEIGLEHPSWREAADAMRAFTARRAGIIDLVALRVSRTLESQGVQPVVLKGPQLAERLYGSAGLRAPSADIDLLVATNDLFRAADVVAGMGWERAADPLLANGLPIHHLEMPGPADAPNVELHWRVQWHDDVGHAEGVLARAERFRGLAVAEPVDLLGVLLLCWVRDGFRGLRLACDVAAWWRTFGEEYGSEVARLWLPGPLQRVFAIGAQAGADVVGTPPPPSSPADVAARLAVRVAATDRPRGRRPGESTQRGLVDVLTCPVGTRRTRFLQSWALDPAVSHAAHPWAPTALVPLLRTASAARTAAESLPIVARAAR